MNFLLVKLELTDTAYNLTKKSKEHFDAFKNDQAIKNIYSHNKQDQTYFSKAGAIKMAQFIKELACDPTSGDTKLCHQFK